MLLTQYEQNGLLFNTNFSEKTSFSGMAAYRGELVIIEGEIADAQGRRKPPVAVMRHAILLTQDDNKLGMIVGCLDRLALLEPLLEHFGKDFTPDTKALFYVVDLTKPVQVEAGGTNIVLIPLTNGVAWNELMDEFALEKSDFKNQPAGDKVVTAWKAFCDYKPKYPKVTMDEAAGFTADIKREAFGAV